MKNNFLVNREHIVFRRANENDNFEEIAELIYKTDPFIYPFWFRNNVENAKKELSRLIGEPGFFFYYDNIYLAYSQEYNRILGIIVAVDKTVDLTYDYTALKSINKRYKYTIENYLEELIKEVEAFDDDGIYISNVCVLDGYRGHKIGSKLLGYFISQMEEEKYDHFHLDCLLHNLRAKNLYHSFGFKEMKLITGFDGTDNSKVEVVNFLRKKGEYYPQEFSKRG